MTTEVTWLGHATVLIELPGVAILTDPVLRDSIGPVRRRADPHGHPLDRVDVVLISHLHHDHLDFPSLARLPADTHLVVPAGGGRLIRGRGFTRVTEVVPGDGLELGVGSASVRAVPARHGGTRLPLGPRAAALGYVVEARHRIWFAGDTGLFPGMTDIAPGLDLDLAILPVGGWGPTLRGGHMDPLAAARAVELTRPRAALPVHWGTLWPIGLGRVRRARFELPAAEFAAAVERRAPEVAVHVLRPGERLTLDD